MEGGEGTDQRLKEFSVEYPVTSPQTLSWYFAVTVVGFVLV